jgi:hypothetical protein
MLRRCASVCVPSRTAWAQRCAHGGGIRTHAHSALAVGGVRLLLPLRLYTHARARALMAFTLYAHQREHAPCKLEIENLRMHVDESRYVCALNCEMPP